MRARRYDRLCVALLATAIPSAAFGQDAAPLESQADQQRLSIKDVSAEPRRLGTLVEQDVTISFNIAGSARGLLRVYDQWRRMVRTIDLGELEGGTHLIAWDGRDDHGLLCRGHRFLYTIHARNDRRQKAVYDPLSVGAGLPVQPHRLALDKATGEISYVLPRPAMVRIRIGMRDGPLMYTLIDWEPQWAGAHEIDWDGKDASGSVSVLEHPKLQVNLTAYALPPNMISVDNDSGDWDPDGANDLPGSQAERAGPHEKTDLHWSCNPAHCHEPRVTIEFLEASTSPDGAGQISSKIPIRVEIDPADLPYLIRKRFELAFFVDGVFFAEEESGTSPLTYYWDTTGLSPGKHFVTVNVVGYDDHIGTATQVVEVGGAR